MTTNAPVLVIPRKPVACSTLAAIGYHADTKTLDIEFRSGGVHRLTGVTPQDFSGLRCAPSIGSHYIRHIRGKFPTESMVETADEGSTPD